MKNQKPASRKKAPGSALLSLPLALLAATAGGTLTALSFPVFNIVPLGWFGMAGMLLAVRGRKFGGAFAMGLITGFICNLAGFYWISNMLQDFAHMESWLSWILTAALIVVQGLVFAFSGAVSAGIISRWPKLPWMLVFPFVFVAVEYSYPLIFPWQLGIGQRAFTAVLQIADMTGTAGISFLIVLVNCAVADVVAARISRNGFPAIQVTVAGAAFIAAIVYGVWRIGEVDARSAAAPKFKIGMVEADIGIWEKEAQNPDGSRMESLDQMKLLYSNLLKHQYLSKTIEDRHHPDLIVWPESAYFPLHRVYSRRTEPAALAVSLGGSVFGIGPEGVKPSDDSGRSPFRDSGLMAVSARTEEDILAAGPKGAIYHYDGRSWSRETTDTDRNINAVAWSHETGEAIAVGDNGVLLVRHRSNENDGEPGAETSTGNKSDIHWKTFDSGRFATLRGAVYAGSMGWVICGDRGTLVSFKDGKITDLAPEGLPDLMAVDWSPEVGVVAVGRFGHMLTVRSRTEVLSEQVSSKTLKSVSIASGDDGTRIWAVGEDGDAVVCRDKCEKVATGVRRNLNAVVADGQDRAWAVGDDGTVLELAGRGTRTASKHDGASGRLVAVTALPFVEGYPYPLDTRKIYVAKTPLPEDGSAESPAEGLKTDRKTPLADRNSVMRGFSTPLIFGAATMERFPPEGREPIKHNSALMIDGEGNVLGTYFKNRLLVFGEYIPLEKWFPFLRKWLPEAGDWTPGSAPALFKLGKARIGISICYEGLLASFHRRIAELEPNLLINITNDAWFGKTAEPWLHLHLAEMRTIETRMWMARSTNTGISAFIDPVGRRVSNTSIDGAEYLTHEVSLTSEKTFYVRHGDVFAWACCGLTILFAAAGIIPRRKR